MSFRPLSLSLYIYTHTYIHTCMHTYIHAYIHTCMHACIYTDTYIYMYLCMYIGVCQYIMTGVSVLLQVCEDLFGPLAAMALQSLEELESQDPGSDTKYRRPP